MHNTAELFVASLARELEINLELEDIHCLIDDWAFGPSNALPFFLTLREKVL